MMTTTRIKDRYFDWLCRLVRSERGGSDGTTLFVFRALFDKEFYAMVPNDDNRAEDGKVLRLEYCRSIGKEGLLFGLDGPCNVLEMIVALARKISENIMVDIVADNTISRWFWEIIDNLGLSRCVDERYFADDMYWRVDDRIETLLSRTYDTNGLGGMFPLRHPTKDQTKVEIWSQANAYLMENYM